MPFVNPYPGGVYLDNNATLPLLPRVREELARSIFSGGELGNPSSIHAPGQQGKKMLFAVKSELSEWLGVGDPEQWIFNSGATEGINTVLATFRGKTIAYSSVDHSAVSESLLPTGDNTFQLEVDSSGQLKESAVDNFIEFARTAPGKVLLCWQLANNETGICFDLQILGRLVRTLNVQAGLKTDNQKLFVLIDGAQAVGKLDDSFVRKAFHLADYFVLSGHKLGAPAGVGALWVRPGAPFSPLVTGGTQERKRRAGTHNVLGITGLGWAVREWREHGVRYRSQMQGLRDFLVSQLSMIEGFCLHCDPHSSPALCNTINFHFTNCADESLVLAMDLEGFYVSSASACNSGSLKPSRVLTNMGYTFEESISSLRVCVGPTTTQAEVELFCARLHHRVNHIRDGRKKWKDLLPEMQLA